MVVEKKSNNKIIEIESSDELYLIDQNIPQEDMVRNYNREIIYLEERENKRASKIYENDITKLDLEF